MHKVILLAIFFGYSCGSKSIAVQVDNESVASTEMFAGTPTTSTTPQETELSLQDRLDRLDGKIGRYRVRDDDDAETILLKKRANFARFHVEHMVRPHPGSSPSTRIKALQQLLVAEVDLAGGPENAIEAHKEILELAKAIESEIRTVYLNGKQPLSDVSEITFFRMEVELQLLRARAKADQKIREQ